MSIKLQPELIDTMNFMMAHGPFFEDKIQAKSSLRPDVIEAIIKARDAKKTNPADDVTADELIDAIAQVASTRDKNTLQTDLNALVTPEFKKNYGAAIVAKISAFMAAANSAAANTPATPVAAVAQNVSRQAAAGAALPATQPISPVEPPEVDAEKTHNGDEPPEAESEETHHSDLTEEESERTIHSNLAEESAESSGPLVPVDTGAIIAS